MAEAPSLLVGNVSDMVDEVPFRPVKKNRCKRRREGSVAVENISMRTDSSSDVDDTGFRTPSNAIKQPENIIFITPIDKTKNLRNVSPITIAKNIRDSCPNPVEFIKPITQGLLVKCKNQKQLRALLQINTIGTIPVKVTEKQEVSRGVIGPIPTETSESELLNELKYQAVTQVKRMTKKIRSDPNSTNSAETNQSNGKFIPLKSVIITFNKPTIPKQVKMCFQIFEVSEYIPPVMRCFRCQRFGHGIGQCKSKMRCVRCGEQHEFENCTKKEQPTCINCGGEHSAAFNGCPEAKKAKQVQQIKIINKVTYAQAAKLLNQERDKKPQENDKTTEQLPDNNGGNDPRDIRPVIPPKSSSQSESAPIRNGPRPDDEDRRVPAPDVKTTNSQTNIFSAMTSEEIILFITELIFSITQLTTENKSKAEITSLVKGTVEKLNLKIKPNPQNEHV